MDLVDVIFSSSKVVRLSNISSFILCGYKIKANLCLYADFVFNQDKEVDNFLVELRNY